MKKVVLSVAITWLAVNSLSAQDHFVPVWTGNGLDQMNFYILTATVDGVGLGAGDEIAVFDDIYCVGSVRLTGPISGYVEIRASRDEETAGINGYREGNPITYRIWDSTADAEYTDVIPSYISGTGLFEISGTASLTLSVTLNQPPVADAGADQEVNEGDPVTLDGSASSDPDADSLRFSWTAPASIILSDNTAIGPAFTAPEVLADTILTFTLTVNDGTVSSGPDTTLVTVRNQNKVPVITGQDSLSVNEETSLTLILSDFTISDGDNDTTDMTLIVSDGVNYSRAGNTILPSVNFIGTLTVPVSVTDGIDTSIVFNAVVTVLNVNDAPVITGQTISFMTNEETPFIIHLSDIAVSDPDNMYPDDFTLLVADSSNYSVTDSTVTPDINFTGTLYIPVTVNDGALSSNPYVVFATITPVNDAPGINSLTAVYTVPEETPFVIRLTDLVVADPDNSYPGDFTLVITDSINYSVSNDSVVTPDAGFQGTLYIPVYVNDGALNSNSFIITATVTGVNQAPVIDSAIVVYNIPEDTPFSISLSDLAVTDPDNLYPDDFTLLVADSTNYTVSDSTITPDLNFNGTLFIPVTVSDGALTSNSFILTATITPVNDPPVIDSVTAVYTVAEDSSFIIRLTDLSVTDPDNVYPDDFTLVIADSTNYSVSNDSTITPDTNFQGILYIPVYVSDGDLNSNIFIITATIGAVNDPPVITGQNPYSFTEDIPFTLQISDLIVSDPDNIPADFTLTLYDSTSYTVSGTTVTPTANYNGTLHIPVTVSDGTNNSNRFVFTAIGTAVNDAPVITGQSPLSLIQGSSIMLLSGYLTVADPDNIPADFSLLVTDSINYSVSGTTVIPDAGFSGTLYVPVQISDGNLLSNKFTLTVTVLPKLTASYTKTDVSTPGGHDGRIDLTVSGGTPPYFYSWNTGAFTQDINFLFEGFYKVTITDAGAQSLSVTIEIKGPQVQPCNFTVDFTYTVDTLTQQVSLDVSTTDYEYFWNFGDGTVSAGQSPEHSYSYPGLYNVCLTAFDAGTNCSYQVCKMIKVGAPQCIADYTFYVDVTDSMLLHFNDNSSGAVSAWYWNFADGNVSTDQDANHKFKNAGTYQVCLYTLDNATGCLSEICKNITIGSVPLAADFTCFVNPVTRKVTFSNNSSGVITDYYWTFGDGMVYSGAETSHNYTDPGIYTVCLSIRNRNSGKFTEICKEIKVGTLPCDLNAEFSYFVDPSTRTVNFTNISSGTINSYFWNFGDGASSSQANTVHQFGKTGYYLVSLSVRNTTTGCTDFQVELIQVGQAECKAMFRYAVDPADLTVTLEDISLGRIKNYFWTFDDGSTSIYKDPFHQYGEPGLYQISLTVTDSTGTCMDYSATDVQVGYVDCSADFTVFIDSLTNTAWFTSQSLGSQIIYYWIFGDGKISTDKNPNHQFLYPGYQKVSLNTYNPLSGCMDYNEKIILVGSQSIDCEADFIYQTDETTNTVSFADRSLGDDLSYYWNFGDESSSQLSNPLHHYSKGGIYNVCLTVYSGSGIQNTTCKPVFAGMAATGNCLAQFMFTVNNDARLVNYTDKSFGTPDHWYWEFGDNSTSGAQYPAKVFNNPGYYVTREQIMIQSTGCISDAFALVSVDMEGGLIAGFGYTIDSTQLKAESYPVDYVGISLGDASKYKWSFGDGSYDSTTTTPTHVYSAPGIYDVCLTIYDEVSGEKNTSCEQVVVGSPGFTGYPFNVNNLVLRCIPNPSDDVCHLVMDLPAAGYTELTVYSVTGSKMRYLVNRHLEGGRHMYEINSSDWGNGLYFLRLQTVSGTVIEKLTIQH